MKFTDTEFFRFLCSGLLNTMLTYLIYLALLLVARYDVAYSLTYLVGVYTSYALNCLIVFRKPFAWRSALQYPVLYLAQYFVGIAIVTALVSHAHIDERIAPLLVLVLMLPVTFVANRLVIVGGSTGNTG